MQILVNGHSQSTIPVQDRGLAYGDGVFETIAVTANNLQFWPQHWQRLQSGLERLNFDCDLVQLKQAIETDIRSLLGPTAAAMSVLKITVTRGVGGRGYLPPSAIQVNRIVQLSPWPTGREQLSHTGVQVRLCSHSWSMNKRLAGLKHLNRLDQVLARQEWQDDDIHEGIMLNQQGNVQSGVMSNVFVEQAGQLITPIIDSAGIAGIMADQIRILADQLGITLRQQQISLDTLQAADALFLTNSLNGIWPVVKYEQLDYAIGPLTQCLQQALGPHISRHCQPIVE